MSIIWNHQIWKSYPSNGLPAGSWHAYGGDDPHSDRVHFSFSWAGALRQTSWWNSGSTNPPPSGEADGSAMVIDEAGDIWMAAVKADGTLYTRRYDVSAAIWNDFTNHGEAWSANAAPALAPQANGHMQLFAVKAGGGLYHHAYEPGTGWGTFVQDTAAWSPASPRRRRPRQRGPHLDLHRRRRRPLHPLLDRHHLDRLPPTLHQLGQLSGADSHASSTSPRHGDPGGGPRGHRRAASTDRWWWERPRRRRRVPGTGRPGDGRGREGRPHDVDIARHAHHRRPVRHGRTRHVR
jgi:hypothetical protein